MCSHYQAEKRRQQIETRFGVTLPPNWEPPPGGLHIYPTQLAPIVRRPPERDSGDEAVPDVEVIEAHFGLLPGFAKDVKYGTRTYNARRETVAKHDTSAPAQQRLTQLLLAPTHQLEPLI